MKKISSSVARRWKLEGYRSPEEMDIACQLNSAKVRWEYEPDRIPYTVEHHYKPDFLIKGKGFKFYVEYKGWFKGADRAKHKRIKKQHPELDIRFVFTNPHQKLYKGSKTTYAEWCIKHGFSYATRRIPDSWLVKLD